MQSHFMLRDNVAEDKIVLTPKLLTQYKKHLTVTATLRTLRLTNNCCFKYFSVTCELIVTCELTQ